MDRQSSVVSGATASGGRARARRGTTALPAASRFLRGISLSKLQDLASRPECHDADTGAPKSISSCWGGDGPLAWCRQTLPPGWDLKTVGADHDWTSWTRMYPGTKPSARHSRLCKYISPDGMEYLNAAPEGTATMYHVAQWEDPDSVGLTTHVCSYPWAMPLCSIVEALAHSLTDWEGEEEPYIFMDVLSDGSHDIVGWAPVEVLQPQELIRTLTKHEQAGLHEDNVWLSEKGKAIAQLAGGVVQVCSKWDDPERLRRAWMMLECVFAVCAKAKITYAMPPEQVQSMAATLREKGPEVILDIVSQVSLSEGSLFASKHDDVQKVFRRIQLLAGERGRTLRDLEGSDAQGSRGTDLEELPANSARKAYAGVIKQEFDRQWQERPLRLSQQQNPPPSGWVAEGQAGPGSSAGIALVNDRRSSEGTGDLP